jgi:Na+-driven multidrug efflux pump
MFATVSSFAILRVALAVLILQVSHGASNWIWLSMAVSTAAAGSIMIYFWHRGKWQSQLV